MRFSSEEYLCACSIGTGSSLFVSRCSLFASISQKMIHQTILTNKNLGTFSDTSTKSCVSDAV